MTLGQIRLFLKEGERINRRERATNARLIRAAVWSDEDGFASAMDSLED